MGHFPEKGPITVETRYKYFFNAFVSDTIWIHSDNFQKLYCVIVMLNWDYLLKYNKIKIFNVVFTVTVNGKDKIYYFADQWAWSFPCMRKNNMQW